MQKLQHEVDKEATYSYRGISMLGMHAKLYCSWIKASAVMDVIIFLLSIFCAFCDLYYFIFYCRRLYCIYVSLTPSVLVKVYGVLRHGNNMLCCLQLNDNYWIKMFLHRLVKNTYVYPQQVRILHWTATPASISSPLHAVLLSCVARLPEGWCQRSPTDW